VLQISKNRNKKKKISSALHRTIYAKEDGIIEYVDGRKNNSKRKKWEKTGV